MLVLYILESISDTKVLGTNGVELENDLMVEIKFWKFPSSGIIRHFLTYILGIYGEKYGEWNWNWSIEDDGPACWVSVLKAYCVRVKVANTGE